jgi:hypothetical protein
MTTLVTKKGNTWFHGTHQNLTDGAVWTFAIDTPRLPEKNSPVFNKLFRKGIFFKLYCKFLILFFEPGVFLLQRYIFFHEKLKLVLKQQETFTQNGSGAQLFFSWRFKVNEDMKRLIEVLNKAGYEVIAFEDRDGDRRDGSYCASGTFHLIVYDTAKGQSKS